MVKVVELTKENEEQYLDQIANLEQIALETMKKEGREGQLFATGKEDISEYVHSDKNTVIVMVGLKNKELVELLRDNGWGMLDLLNWVAFAKANGQIK